MGVGAEPRDAGHLTDMLQKSELRGTGRHFGMQSYVTMKCNKGSLLQHVNALQEFQNNHHKGK